VPATLAVLAELDPERPAAVCRELTKVHEEVVRGTAAELAQRYSAEPPKGEVVLVIGGPPEAGDEPTPVQLDAVTRLVEAGAKTRAAAGVVADLTGGSANALYRAYTERG
jgi:16S rRNA (cytidine1402-2'-O)-methyltransferase